jgi:tRNA threonylcarbamoyladenosine biosynthesis protein TsaE
MNIAAPGENHQSPSLALPLPEEAATLALGARIGAGLAPGLQIHLRGDLGAGKTTLVRGVLRALGWTGRVKSPTYTLVEHYLVSRLHLYHFDFYRFERPSEWLEAGFAEHFNTHAVCLVEWPERAGAALGVPDLELELIVAADARQARINAHTPAGRALLAHCPVRA